MHILHSAARGKRRDTGEGVHHSANRQYHAHWLYMWVPVLTDCSRDEASTSLCGAEVDGKASLDNSFGSESLDRQEVKGSLVQHTLCMHHTGSEM